MTPLVIIISPHEHLIIDQLVFLIDRVQDINLLCGFVEVMCKRVYIWGGEGVLLLLLFLPMVMSVTTVDELWLLLDVLMLKLM